MERLYSPTELLPTAVASAALSSAAAGSSVCIAVVGATGRTGSIVVKLLLERKCRVRALVRKADAAQKILPVDNPNLTVTKGSLSDVHSLRDLCQGVGGVIVTSGSLSPLGIFNQNNSPYNVDFLGMRNVLDVISGRPSVRVVLVSTVGLTRPFRPVSFVLEAFGGGVMKWKAEGERILRESAHPYAVVRPALLKNSDTPTELSSRTTIEQLVVDQGDKIDGWINRSDLALVCVEAMLAGVQGAAVAMPVRCTFEVTGSPVRANATCSEPSRDPRELLKHVRPDPAGPQ